MKKSISGIITCLLFTLFFFNGCSNDSDETKVTYTYSLSVDYTGKESTGDSDPALIAIDMKIEHICKLFTMGSNRKRRNKRRCGKRCRFAGTDCL